MNLMQVKTNWIKYYNYLTVIFSLFLLFGTGGSSIALVIWGLFSLFVFIKYRQYSYLSKKDVYNIIILSFIPLSYILSILFVEDKKMIINLVTRSLPLLVFPLFFVFNQRLFYEETLGRSLITFSMSNLILAVLPWIKIFGIGYEKLLAENSFYNPVFRNIFSEVTGFHLPYLGLFFGFSIYILLIAFLKERVKWIQFFYLVVSLILVVSILQFAARMGLLSLIIALILAVLFKVKQSVKMKLIVGISVLFIAIGLAFVEPMKSRIFSYTDGFKMELPHKGQLPEDFNPRYGIYNCVVSIIKDNFLRGVGPTNEQKALNNCYNQYDYESYDDFKHIDYNSHNQYADFLIKYGIGGFILFLISLLWGMKNKNIFYFGFITIIVISLFTENVLFRHFGIFFYAFFNSLFFTFYINSKALNKKESSEYN